MIFFFFKSGNTKMVIMKACVPLPELVTRGTKSGWLGLTHAGQQKAWSSRCKGAGPRARPQELAQVRWQCGEGSCEGGGSCETTSSNPYFLEWMDSDSES